MTTRLRRALRRWASSDDQLARELRRESAHERCVPIAEAPDRENVRLRGFLRTVTLRPRGGVPALEAELYDGSRSLTLIWLGRRQIAGIVPGRSMEVEGRVGLHGGSRIMFNPRYELRP